MGESEGKCVGESEGMRYFAWPAAVRGDPSVWARARAGAVVSELYQGGGSGACASQMQSGDIYEARENVWVREVVCSERVYVCARGVYQMIQCVRVAFYTG